MTTVTIRELDTSSEGGEAFKALLSCAYAEFQRLPFHRPTESVTEEILVAEIEGVLVGYGLLQRGRAKGDCDQVTEVFVLPEHRRRGVGTALIKALVASAPSGFVVALTAPAATGVKRFLEDCGFETREPRGVILDDDRQPFWQISHELRAGWLLERAADQQRLAEAKLREAERRAYWDKMWDWKTGWRNEQERRRNGQGIPRLLIAGQTLDYIEVLTHPLGTGNA